MPRLLVVHHTTSPAVLGDPGREDLQACWELGAAMAAGLGLP
jgi:hypothetical protein